MNRNLVMINRKLSLIRAEIESYRSRSSPLRDNEDYRQFVRQLDRKINRVNDQIFRGQFTDAIQEELDGELWQVANDSIFEFYNGNIGTRNFQDDRQRRREQAPWQADTQSERPMQPIPAAVETLPQLVDRLTDTITHMNVEDTRERRRAIDSTNQQHEQIQSILRRLRTNVTENAMNPEIETMRRTIRALQNNMQTEQITSRNYRNTIAQNTTMLRQSRDEIAEFNKCNPHDEVGFRPRCNLPKCRNRTADCPFGENLNFDCIKNSDHWHAPNQVCHSRRELVRWRRTSGNNNLPDRSGTFPNFPGVSESEH